MVRRLKFICIFLGALILLPSMGFAQQELGKPGFLDQMVQHPAFNLWLPADWDPVGKNILRMYYSWLIRSGPMTYGFRKINFPGFQFHHCPLEKCAYEQKTDKK